MKHQENGGVIWYR